MSKKVTNNRKLVIGIVGIGNVGSTIASFLMFHPRVKQIQIADRVVDTFKGHLEDLIQMGYLSGRKDVIKRVGLRNMSAQCDLIFVTAGIPRRSSSETMDEIRDKNYEITRRISRYLQKHKMVLVTNPVDYLASALNVKSIGHKLDSMRKRYNMKDGIWIVDKKGTSNFGISMEAFKFVSNYK